MLDGLKMYVNEDKAAHVSKHHFMKARNRNRDKV